MRRAGVFVARFCWLHWAMGVVGLAFLAALAGEAANTRGLRPSALAAEPPAAAAERLPAENWPLFRGDSLARGVSAAKLPDKPELVWKRSYKEKDESFEATAAIHGGVVYLGGLNGPLYALDLASGEEKWQFKSEGGFKAAASVREGRIFIGDVDGKFYCLDAATGQPKWTYKADAEIDNGANFYKGNVLFGSQDANLYCLEAATGKLVWKYTIGDQIRCFPTVVGNRAFVAGCDGTLHIVDLDAGKSVGGVPIGGPTGCTPAVLGDVAYFGTEGEKFFAVNWREAKNLWTYEHEERKVAYRSSAAATDEVIVVGNRGKFVVGLDPKTGKQAWIYNTRTPIDSSPVIVGERAFFGTGRGQILAVNIKTGKLAWEYEAGGGFPASPAVAAGRLVIASDDGVVYCFGAK
jgi:outer membrane protein assembly factor BamB